MARVAMGGTFDVFHAGHEALLDAAFAVGDEEVAVGVTTDAFASAHREREVRPYEERAASVTRFARERGAAARVRVEPIDTPFGFALDPRFTHIVATVETAGTAEKINEARGQAGAPPLELVLAPYVLADDARPIKATRVRAGEIDAQGRLKRPARVAVGSDNPVKVEAVKRALAKLFAQVDVRGFAVDPGVALQPFEAATWEGATTRARLALDAWPEADFGVGIEAGLFEVDLGGDEPQTPVVFDVQACGVIDRAGRLTYGQGPGFAYPPEVVREIRRGKTVGDVMSRVAGISEIGKKTGAVGWLSRGHFTRTALTEPAVLMAFLPRQRPALYGL